MCWVFCFVETTWPYVHEITQQGIYCRPFAGEGAPTRDNGILDARTRWYSGDLATILCPWGLLSGVIATLHSLGTEERTADLFVISDYRFKRSKALIESIKTTEHCIILLDAQPTSIYKELLTLTCMQKQEALPPVISCYLLPSHQLLSSTMTYDIKQDFLQKWSTNVYQKCLVSSTLSCWAERRIQETWNTDNTFVILSWAKGEAKLRHSERSEESRKTSSSKVNLL